MNETPPDLPKEADARLVEDADVRGAAVRLQGGEVWHVPALSLSPRGTKIAEQMDRMESLEIDLRAAQRRVEIAEGRMDAAEDEDAIERATDALKACCQARTKIVHHVEGAQAEIAYHALRCHYRVSREQATALVTQACFEEVLAALNGQKTKMSEVAFAVEVIRRVKQEQGGGEDDSDDPLAVAKSSVGGATS